MSDKIKQFSEQRRIEVSYGKTIEIDGSWVKSHCTFSKNIPDGVDETEALEEMWDFVGNQVESIVGDEQEETELPPPVKKETPKKIEEKPKPAPEKPKKEKPIEKVIEKEIEKVIEKEIEKVMEDDEDQITEEQINKMSLAELKEFCNTTEGLEDIDLTLDVKKLRKLLIDTIFEEEEESSDSEETTDWDDDDWADD